MFPPVQPGPSGEREDIQTDTGVSFGGQRTRGQGAVLWEHRGADWEPLGGMLHVIIFSGWLELGR